MLRDMVEDERESLKDGGRVCVDYVTVSAAVSSDVVCFRHRVRSGDSEHPPADATSSYENTSEFAVSTKMVILR